MRNLLLLLLSFSGLAFADEMEIIPLKHRSADEVLPIIRPLLDQDGAASGMNYQLILRTAPQNLTQIKKLLEKIDLPPRRLQISVMQNVDNETVTRLTEVSGSIGLGRDARISVPGSGDNSGLNVGIGTGRDRLNARVISTRSLDDEHKTQQIQVLEGGRARVSSGQSVPIAQHQVIQQPWGTQVIESTQYQDVNSGFFVQPRLNGDIVTVEISAQNDSVAPNSGNTPKLRTQLTSTTVSGRLGVWLVVGGTEQQTDSNDDTISTRRAGAASEQRKMLIKVEEIN